MAKTKQTFHVPFKPRDLYNEARNAYALLNRRSVQGFEKADELVTAGKFLGKLIKSLEEQGFGPDDNVTAS